MGQSFTVFVNDAPEWSNKTISVQIESSDDIEPLMMAMSFSMEIGDDGAGSWHHASGFEIDRESVVFVSAAGIARHRLIPNRRNLRLHRNSIIPSTCQ
jgi:hypothetical protein